MEPTVRTSRRSHLGSGEWKNGVSLYNVIGFYLLRTLTTWTVPITDHVAEAGPPVVEVKPSLDRNRSFFLLSR